MHHAFKPPLLTRIGAVATATRQVVGELPLSTAISVLGGTAARMDPVLARIRGEAGPVTAATDAVTQAIGGAIALYQALLAHTDPATARRLVDAVVVRAGVQLMDRAFPALDPRGAGGAPPLEQLSRFVLDALGSAERHGLYRVRNIRQGPTHLAFDITYCHYVDCCRVAGVPELARAFCNVDGPFFAGLSRQIAFACPRRLSRGEPACTFEFTAR